MKSYKELDVWNKCRELVVDIYQLTNTFPSEEKFGLINQMRRASVSVVSNIAEGHGRNYAKETIQFLHISKGSLFEIETQLYVSIDLKFTTEENCKELFSKINDCIRMTVGLIKYFEKLL